MAEPRVTDIRGLDIAVRDLPTSVDFYTRVWGLEEASRDGSTVYLRATGQEHHVLALHQGPKIAIMAANYAVPDKMTVDALHAKAVAAGADVLNAPHALPAAAGGGYGFDVRTPDGIRQTISSDVERHTRTIVDHRRPRKFSHVVFRSANYPQLEAFLCDILGFKLSDRTDGIDFFHCSRDHHSVALGKIAGPGLHHMAFELPDPNGIATEYTTDMDQVDDATYPSRSAEEWRTVPMQPCMWGMGIERSEKLLLARTGKLIEELNRSCTDAISQKLAS
jgi:catechol 2,3-dioxygenase-like lactoylglutathione lyase family enzyme